MMQYWKKTMTSLQPTYKERQLSHRPPPWASLQETRGAGGVSSQATERISQAHGHPPGLLLSEDQARRRLQAGSAQASGLCQHSRGLPPQQEQHPNSGAGRQLANCVRYCQLPTASEGIFQRRNLRPREGNVFLSKRLIKFSPG